MFPHERRMTVNASPSVGGSGAAVTPLRAWMPALVSVTIACAVFGLAFQREIVGAVRVWTQSTAYNHCFLVLPLVAALLWNRREAVVLLRPWPAPWALALVLALSVVWLAAALLDILEAEQLVVVALFEVLLLVVLGWRVFRTLLAPLLFLFFLVPFGAFLVPALQRFTAVFAVNGLQLLGIPVFADGLIIQIPEGLFEVAEACAGLRFLIASIVFGCFFATIVYRRWPRRIVFIALSILLPIVANGLRALGLVVLAHVEGSAAAALADHVLYGWIFFTLVTLVLIAIGMTFVDGPRRIAVSPAVSPAFASRQRIGATMAAGLLMTVLGPAYLMVIERASAEPLAPVLLGPPADSAWVREPAAAADWRPLVTGASRESTETYHDGDGEVTEFLALYRLPARGSPLTRTVNAVADPDAWHVTATGRMTASLGHTPVAVNTAAIVQRAHHRLVWWFYVVDGRATASTLEAKLLQARAALLGGAHVGAYIAISTEGDDVAPQNASLARFLEALGPLPAIRAAATR
jgi:exosortase A